MECLLVEPITALSHQEVKVSTSKQHTKLLSYLFIYSNEVKIPSKLEQRIEQMRQAKKLVSQAILPSDHDHQIGFTHQLVFADSSALYVERSTQLYNEMKNNAYNIDDNRKYRGICKARTVIADSKALFQTLVEDLNLDVEFQIIKTCNGDICIQEKLVFWLTTDSATTLILNSLKPYTYTWATPETEKPPIFLNEELRYGNGRMELQQKVKLNHPCGFDEIWQNNCSFTIIEDRAYFQSKINFVPHYFNSSFSPSVKGIKTATDVDETESTQQDTIKSQCSSTLSTKNNFLQLQPSKRFGFPISDFMNSKNSDTNEKQKEFPLAIREKSPYKSPQRDNTMEDVASLKEDKSLRSEDDELGLKKAHPEQVTPLAKSSKHDETFGTRSTNNLVHQTTDSDVTFVSASLPFSCNTKKEKSLTFSNDLNNIEVSKTSKNTLPSTAKSTKSPFHSHIANNNANLDSNDETLIPKFNNSNAFQKLNFDGSSFTHDQDAFKTQVPLKVFSKRPKVLTNLYNHQKLVTLQAIVDGIPTVINVNIYLQSAKASSEIKVIELWVNNERICRKSPRRP